MRPALIFAAAVWTVICFTGVVGAVYKIMEAQERYASCSY